MDRDGLTVPPLDERVMATAYARQAGWGRPPGVLGKLEGLAVWLAGVQRRCPPAPLARRRLVVVAGDHAVADRGVSLLAPDAVPQVVTDLRDAPAPAAVLAGQFAATVRVLDAGRSAGSIDREPATDRAAAEAAFASGRAVADDEVDSGADVLAVAVVGRGSTTVAAALVCALAGTEPAETVGRGSGVDDAGWMRKVGVVRDALARSRPAGREPFDVAADLGGAGFLGAAGLLAGAAARRTPVVLDGVTSVAAALLAAQCAPAAPAYWLAAHRTAEPAQRIALDWLGLAPLLDLGLRTGDGTGALLALPVLDAAVALLAAAPADDGPADAGGEPGGAPG